MMKNRIIRYNFNMVEVMLAVIVVSVGIASTFVLFPVGLNASRDAAAEHRLADISEVALSIIQSEILPEIVENDANKGYCFDSSKLNNYFCAQPKSDDNTAIDQPDVLEKLDSFTKKDNLYNAGPGLYVYAVEHGDVVDFAAAVKIYLDGSGDSCFANEYFFSKDGGTYSALDAKYKHLTKYLLPVVVEISWPVTLPYAEREKRTFRFEMFNNEYDPQKDTAA